MSKHDMGPSTVAGFEQQCRKCKALDTEIRFALGDECPVEDEEPRATVTVIGDPFSPDPTAMQAYKASVIVWQANWFEGYFQRQFNRALGGC